MARPEKKALKTTLRDLQASQTALDSYTTKIAKKGDKKLRKLTAELTKTSSSASKLFAGVKKSNATSPLDELGKRESKRIAKADKTIREPMARASATRLISAHVGEVRAAAQIALAASERKTSSTLTRLADAYGSSLARLDGAAARASSSAKIKAKSKAKPKAKAVAKKSSTKAKSASKTKAVIKAKAKVAAKTKPKTAAKNASKATPKLTAKAKTKKPTTSKTVTGRTPAKRKSADSKTTARRRATSKA